MTDNHIYKFDADHSVDLTVYRPEKALHLEWADVMTEPLEKIKTLTKQIDSLENERVVHRNQKVMQKLTEKGWDRKSFARVVFALYPERTDFGKFCNHYVYPFLETGKVYEYGRNAQSVLEQMAQLLGLTMNEPKSSEQIELEMERGRLKRSLDTVELFIKHFSLLWHYREGICNTPELFSITVHRAGCFVGFNHDAKLGELLFLYNLGKLRFEKNCPKCNSEMLLYRTGGFLGSGRGDRSGFCPQCGEFLNISGHHGGYFRQFFELKPPCPEVETNWTMAGLVQALMRFDEH